MTLYLFCRFGILFSFFFFFNDTATTEIYTLSLHDALPICRWRRSPVPPSCTAGSGSRPGRSEEHTSELQSRRDLVCRLLLEKKKNKMINLQHHVDKDMNNPTYIELFLFVDGAESTWTVLLRLGFKKCPRSLFFF